MNKLVAVLAVIAILALGLSVWLSQSSIKGKFEAELLFADLAEFANQVDRVEITNAQGVLFSAQKLGDSWLATFDPEQPVYPVSQEKLADFVKTLMRVKLVETKTRKPQNYARLGLKSIDHEDSMASFVSLNAAGKSWQVLVGNKVSIGEGHYILKPENAQSWRTDKTIHLPFDRFAWLKQPILPFQAQDISSVSRVDSLEWQITRGSSGDFQLSNMPKGRELEYASILNSIVSNLTNLDFEELLKADEDFTQSLTVLTQLEVSTTDQEIFQLVVSALDGKHFVSFSAREKSKYWQKWHYQISHFSAQQLIKTMDDFLVEQSSITNDDEKKPQAIDEGDAPS
ncbi:MAG: DUF4340 domain-containing protein [Paraglaciecola sp.]|nr:DUF4340 domain-containing protein [Paraglaciecola sp.]